jgi:hypothetical protein
LANYKGLLQLLCNPFKKTEHWDLDKAKLLPFKKQSIRDCFSCFVTLSKKTEHRDLDKAKLLPFKKQSIRD